MNNFGEKASFIWSVADLLRGPYRPNQYKDVMLPMTVLRRLDCVLEPTKDKVLEGIKKFQGSKFKKVEPILCQGEKGTLLKSIKIVYLAPLFESPSQPPFPLLLIDGQSPPSKSPFPDLA